MPEAEWLETEGRGELLRVAQWTLASPMPSRKGRRNFAVA